MVTKFTDSDDEITVSDQPQRLANIPDYERQIEFVARERATWAWGRLRALSVFDSAQAEQILTEAIMEAVAASKKPNDDKDRLFEQLHSACRKLRFCVLKLWGDLKPQRDPSKGSIKVCRVCGGSKTSHAAECVVGKALALASQLTLGDD